jgi:flagellar protein FlaG
LEVPSKKILDMVASMCKEVGLLDKKAWFIKKTI